MNDQQKPTRWRRERNKKDTTESVARLDDQRFDLTKYGKLVDQFLETRRAARERARNETEQQS